MRHRGMFNKSTLAGYRIENKAEKQEIFIYDEIGSPGGFWGVDPEQFAKDLNDMKGNVTIRINSPGGSVFGGMSIANAIKNYDGNATTVIDGLAASAASYIAVSGGTVKINQGAFLMIHEAWSLAIGNANDFRKEADLLEKIDSQIAGFYARKTGKDLTEIQEIMTDETWFTADEAKEFGLVDEVIEQEKPAENLFDLSVFNKTPESLKSFDDCDTQEDSDTLPTRKEIEKLLRNAGLSRQKAKAFYSGGIEQIRDKEEPDDKTKIEKQKLHRKIQLLKTERTEQ